jgi:tRNA nucleotidyltransferase (CCA-adding enzyme)
MYQQLKEDRVITLREGRIFKVKEFKEKYVDSGDQRNGKFWRFSEVNIQDPLELSHNIAANVSRESLAKLRWKVM